MDESLLKLQTNPCQLSIACFSSPIFSGSFFNLFKQDFSFNSCVCQKTNSQTRCKLGVVGRGTQELLPLAKNVVGDSWKEPREIVKKGAFCSDQLSTLAKFDVYNP